MDSLETKRKIKRFERYANIEIPEFLKIGIVIRQAEAGPMRTHLVMNSHRLATFQDIKTEETNAPSGPRVQRWEGRATRWTWMRSRRDRPMVLPKVPARARTQKLRVVRIAIADHPNLGRAGQ